MSFALILGMWTSRRSTCAGITGSGTDSAGRAVAGALSAAIRNGRIVGFGMCRPRSEKECGARGQLGIGVRTIVVDQRYMPLRLEAQEKLARDVVTQPDGRVGDISPGLDRADERGLRRIGEATRSEREKRGPARVWKRLRHERAVEQGRGGEVARRLRDRELDQEIVVHAVAGVGRQQGIALESTEGKTELQPPREVVVEQYVAKCLLFSGPGERRLHLRARHPPFPAASRPHLEPVGVPPENFHPLAPLRDVEDRISATRTGMLF